MQPQMDVQPEAQQIGGEAATAPKRRGRPRKIPVGTSEQLGFDASALPPSIGSEAPAEDAAPKPRRRRSIATPAEVEA